MNSAAMELEHGGSSDYREGLRLATLVDQVATIIMPAVRAWCANPPAQDGMPVQMLGDEPAANGGWCEGCTPDNCMGCGTQPDVELDVCGNCFAVHPAGHELPLQIKRTLPDAQLPTYGTDGAGAFDVRAAGLGHYTHTVQPGAARTFSTGLAFEIPPGWSMLVLSRSGHGFKQDVRLANCVGLIDSDYRGTVGVRLTADAHGSGIAVRNGDRIAQCLLVRTPRWRFVEVDELSDTARGDGGFGSTGR